MNIIIKDFSYKLVKTEETDNYIEYDVYKADTRIGYITKTGAEIHYTARDTEDTIKATAATLRDTLERMVLNMFYSHTYKGDKMICAIGEWKEGAKLDIEYEKDGYVKHAKRSVRYDRAAGDLCIVIENRKYFYYEFN